MKFVYILGACALLTLTACSKHDGTHATDVVHTAEENAKALAPTAEPIKFDDEHLPKMGGTTENTTAEAVAEAAETPSENTAEAVAEESATTESTESAQ